MIPCGKYITPGYAGEPDPDPPRCTERRLCDNCTETHNHKEKLITEKEIIHQLLKYITPKCGCCTNPATIVRRFDGTRLFVYCCDEHKLEDAQINNGHKTFFMRHVDLDSAAVIRRAMELVK